MLPFIYIHPWVARRVDLNADKIDRINFDFHVLEQWYVFLPKRQQNIYLDTAL